jgi:hypothetical protein
LPNIEVLIDTLTNDVVERNQSLDGALFALQSWFDQNVESMDDDERVNFSNKLNAEKDATQREGQPHGDDASLVSSVLRLHVMRLLYRYDEKQQSVAPPLDDTPYERARRRLQIALRETELAVNEARVDTAIANAHNIMDDRNANRRWLQDALTRLQTVAQKDLLRMANSVPMPTMPPLNPFQKAGFWVLGITQEEIGKRNLLSLKKLATLQNNQLIEMAHLLAESFGAIEDPIGAKQAQTLLTELGEEQEQ